MRRATYFFMQFHGAQLTPPLILVYAPPDVAARKIWQAVKRMARTYNDGRPMAWQDIMVMGTDSEPEALWDKWMKAPDPAKRHLWQIAPDATFKRMDEGTPAPQETQGDPW